MKKSKTQKVTKGLKIRFIDGSQSLNESERVKRRGMDDSYMIKTNCSRVDVWVLLRRFEALSALNGILKSRVM